MTDSSSSNPPNSGSLAAGTRLGEFVISELIGRGGFAEVYRAQQPRWRRDVAIKVLLTNICEEIPDARERFQREIDVVRRLEHPNIVCLYDAGESADGMPWMAMELVAGDRLDDLMRLGPMSATRVRTLGLQMLSGLVSAHQQNIVHRDLKPGNIMLTRRPGQAETVKILDFGLGKLFGPGADDHSITKTGTAGYGTPRYMAPEQIRNDEIGPHTDNYAVGLILIELLTGRPAITGSTSYAILANQLVQEPHLDSWLEASELGDLLRRCTEKEWEERFTDTLELYRALESVPLPTRDATEGAAAPAPPRYRIGPLAPAAGTVPVDNLALSVGVGPGLDADAAVRPTTSPGARSAPDAELPVGGTREAPKRSAMRWALPLALASIALAVTVGGLMAQREAGVPSGPASAAATPPTAGAPEAAGEPADPERGQETSVAGAAADPERGQETSVAGAPAAPQHGGVGAQDAPPTAAEPGAVEATASPSPADAAIALPSGEAGAEAPRRVDVFAKAAADLGSCTVRIESQPTSQVFVHDRVVCGVTPCAFVVPRSGVPLDVLLRAEGHHDLTRHVDVSGSQQALMVVLAAR